MRAYAEFFLGARPARAMVRFGVPGVLVAVEAIAFAGGPRCVTSVSLNSLVNIDRNSLVTILASEVEAAQRSVNSARQRTASQRAKRRGAEDHLARVERILCYFQHGDIATDMPERDVELCKSIEQKLRQIQRPV